jgi:hypothetical protein
MSSRAPGSTARPFGVPRTRERLAVVFRVVGPEVSGEVG